MDRGFVHLVKREFKMSRKKIINKIINSDGLLYFHFYGDSSPSKISFNRLNGLSTEELYNLLSMSHTLNDLPSYDEIENVTLNIKIKT